MLKLVGVIGFILMTFVGLCQDLDSNEKYQDFEVIKVLDRGDEVIGRLLTAEDVTKVSFSPIFEVTNIQIDPYTYFSVVNSVIYLDWNAFAFENTLGVVNPHFFEGEVLAITPESYMYLLEQNDVVYYTLAEAELYFSLVELDPFDEKSQRVIDPASCSNPEHGGGAPHRVNPHNWDSACHGSAGDDSGSCTNVNSNNLTYNVQCSIGISPTGENCSSCVATITCADGGYGTQRDGSQARTITCKGYNGVSATAGSDGGVGTIDCGGVPYTLDCSR